MIDAAVQRVLERELQKLRLLVNDTVFHPARDRMFVECGSEEYAAIAADQLEAMGFKIERPSMPGQRYFNVHLSMEKRAKAVYEIKAAVEMPGDDVDDVRAQIIEQLEALGARVLVFDVKVLIDRETKR